MTSIISEPCLCFVIKVRAWKEEERKRRSIELRSIYFSMVQTLKVSISKIFWKFHPSLFGLIVIVQDRYLIILKDINYELVFSTIFKEYAVALVH